MPHTQPAPAHADATPAPRQLTANAQHFHTTHKALVALQVNSLIARHTSPLLREQADLIRVPQPVVERDDSEHRTVKAMFDAQWLSAGGAR